VKRPCIIRVSLTNRDRQGKTDIKGFFWYDVRHVNNENGTHILLILLAIPAGLEPATRGVEIRYSIQLSYGTVPPRP
jgi:hypothetical protein